METDDLLSAVEEVGAVFEEILAKGAFGGCFDLGMIQLMERSEMAAI